MANDIFQKITFEEYLESSKIRDARNVSGIALFIVLFFLIVEVFLFSTPLVEQIRYRDLLLISIFFGYITTYHPLFIKYYNQSFFITYLGAAIGLIRAVPLIVPEQFVPLIYLGGITLFVFIAFLSSYLKNITYMLLVTFIIGSYVYMAKKLGISNHEEVMLTTTFLVATSITGFYINKLKHRYLLDNFNLQQSLISKVELKTEEANSHAYLANHDELTGLSNRRHVIERLNKLLIKVRSSGTHLAILFIDLNGFKPINDKHGHFIGDNVLKMVAARLNKIIKKEDCLARLGGDEFLIGVQLNENKLHRINDISNRIKNTIEKPMNIEGISLLVTASIGVATYPAHGDTIEKLIDVADKKMYQVKHRDKPTSNIKRSNWFPKIPKATPQVHQVKVENNNKPRDITLN